MNYAFHHFEQLSTNQLYAILRLREQVFVIEQKSIYEDVDNHDQNALHLLVTEENSGKLVAYSRLLAAANCPEKVKIQRVVVAATHRNQSLGRLMMNRIVDYCLQRSEIQYLTLSAQTNVVRFYRKWRFETVGQCYDDGGIEHIDMQVELASLNKF